MAVAPADRKLDLKALAAGAHAKSAVMAEPKDAERATGYVTGGISPLGQKKPLRTFVDAQAAAHETVFVSAGRRGMEIEIRPADLVELTGGCYLTLT